MRSPAAVLAVHPLLLPDGLQRDVVGHGRGRRGGAGRDALPSSASLGSARLGRARLGSPRGRAQQHAGAAPAPPAPVRPASPPASLRPGSARSGPGLCPLLYAAPSGSRPPAPPCPRPKPPQRAGVWGAPRACAHLAPHSCRARGLSPTRGSARFWVLTRISSANPGRNCSNVSTLFVTYIFFL